MARVLISIPDEMLSAIDEVAAQESRSRSELIRECFRRYALKNKKMNVKLHDSNASILERLLD